MKLVLDAGGVLVYPAHTYWQVGEAMANSSIAASLKTPAYQRAHEACKIHLREDVRMDTEEEEVACRTRYLACVDRMMGWGLPPEEIARLSRDCVENPRRMGVYADAAVYLPRWQKRWGVGLLSDTTPSLERILRANGLWEYLDAHVFSTDVGAIKPSMRMYERIVQLLGVKAKECLFVDDLERNLRGALAAGMRAVQMAREDSVARWDGPVVGDFAELDAYASAL